MAGPQVFSQSFEVNLPSGLKGSARLRIDLQALAQELAWKAYYNARKRTVLKNGIVQVEICPDAIPSRKA